MSMKEEVYSAYLEWQSNYSTTWALFSGFTFTAITILLSQGPDPNQIPVQITLFILTVLLDTFLSQLYTRRAIMENCVRIAPPLPEGTVTRGPLVLLANEFGWILLGASVVLMFFVWNLIYLTLASGAFGLLTIIFTYYTHTKPFNKFLKEHPFIRK